MKTIKFFLFWLSITASVLHAQNEVSLNSKGTIAKMKFDTARNLSMETVFTQIMQLSPANRFEVTDRFELTGSFSAVRMKQSYHNIPVEDASISSAELKYNFVFLQSN